jgi:Mce-associated membrane protein
MNRNSTTATDEVDTGLERVEDSPPAAETDGADSGAEGRGETAGPDREAGADGVAGDDPAAEPVVRDASTDVAATDVSAADVSATDGTATDGDAAADSDAGADDGAAVDVADPAADGVLAAPGQRGAGGRWLGTVAVLVVLLAGVLTAGGVLITQARASAELRADREAVLAVATDVVAGMVSINGAAAAGNLGRISDQTTDPLRGQLSGFSKVFETLLQEGQVESVGSVGDSGVESLGAGSATVLLSVNASVTNSEVPDGVQRSFRMVVSLSEVDGRWLASAVDVLA